MTALNTYFKWMQKVENYSWGWVSPLHVKYWKAPGWMLEGPARHSLYPAQDRWPGDRWESSHRAFRLLVLWVLAWKGFNFCTTTRERPLGNQSEGSPKFSWTRSRRKAVTLGRRKFMKHSFSDFYSCLSCTSMLLSLSFSLPSPLSKNK